MRILGIALVLMSILLAGCVFYSDLGKLQDDFEGQDGDGSQQPANSCPVPQISFIKSAAASGSTDFTVSKVTCGPVPWTDLEIMCAGGALTIDNQGETVGPGDVLNCSASSTKITMVHEPTDTLLYSQNL